MSPIYDNNGTTDHLISSVYDNNGTTDSVMAFVYDNNGTSDQEVYSQVVKLSDKEHTQTLEEIYPGHMVFIIGGSYYENGTFDRWIPNWDAEYGGKTPRKLEYDIRILIQRLNDHTVAKVHKRRTAKDPGTPSITDLEDPYGEYAQSKSIIGVPYDNEIYWQKSVHYSSNEHFYYPVSDSSRMSSSIQYHVVQKPYTGLQEPNEFNLRYSYYIARLNEDTDPQLFPGNNPPSDGSSLDSASRGSLPGSTTIEPRIKPKATFTIYISNAKAYF